MNPSTSAASELRKDTRRPERKSPLKYRLSKRFNVVPRIILRSPLHRLMSGGFVLLSVVGRNSGKCYTFPVAYHEHDGSLLMGTDDRPWRRNVRTGDWIEIWHRGNSRRAEVEVFTDQPEVGRLLGVILPRNPVLSRFLHIRVEKGTMNADDVRKAVDRGVAVIRLHPE